MKKYKVRAEISGWATVACCDDCYDDDEDENCYEDIDSGDYDYSAGNSGASYNKEVVVEVKAPDDMSTDSEEFRDLVKVVPCEELYIGKDFLEASSSKVRNKFISELMEMYLDDADWYNKL